MPEKAAFFRLEGALSPVPTMASAAWLAGHNPRLRSRVARLGDLALTAPLLLGGPLKSPGAGTRVTWMGLRDLGEDRLVEMGREFAERFLIPRLRPAGVRLVREAKKDHTVILLSSNIAAVVEPIAAHLGVDEVVCNRMEMRHGRATGRLAEPVIHGHVGSEWARRFAEERGIDLKASSAYAGLDEDTLLLSAAGFPCAVHPRRHLRHVAADLHWPIVEG